MTPLRPEVKFNERVTRSSDRYIYQFRLRVSAISPNIYTQLLCPEKPQFIPLTVIFCVSMTAPLVTIHHILCGFSPQVNAATLR
jgi:hypothetical protein